MDAMEGSVMTNTAKERFTISTAGMAELHRDRQPWSLIKELIANAWDEDSANRCDVTIEPAKGGVLVQVADNGKGFKDIDDSFTLLAASDKRGSAEKRGRFNVGEKEIISIATHAKVITVGHTVSFPEDGGRRVDPNKRKSGTIIECLVDWDPEVIPETVKMLSMFLAPIGETYIINGVDYSPTTEIIASMKSDLETVIQEAANRPMRRTRRKADVFIRESISGEGWLYELGIPVQKIEPPFLVDVYQKIPLSQTRDAAPARFLRDIYASILNEVVHLIPDEKAGEAWIHEALSKPERVNETAVKAVVNARYGDKVVLWSRDGQANEDAQTAGYTVIHPNALSTSERQSIKGVVSTSVEVFPDVTGLRGVEDVKPDKHMTHIADYAKWLGSGLLAKEINVDFKSAKIMNGTNWLARYTEASDLLSFNVEALGKSWFVGNITSNHTSLILHELAHDGDSSSPHQGDYVDRLADLGAQAIHLALLGKQNWFK